MWILISLNEHGQEEGPHFLLHKSKKYTLGRKDCDILINDKSVSRLHAELLVSPLKNPSDANSLAKLTVIDKSKFGTFVNRVRCEVDKEIILKEGDIIVFGVNNSQLKVKYQPIDICFSNVKPEIKASVQNTLMKIGAHVYNDYVPTKITHLVMTELEVTSKVLLALTDCIHVITPQWLLDVEAKNDGLVAPLPDAAKYLPPLKEDECSLHQFKPDPKRRTLFSGKTFIFMTEKQYLKAYRIVETAGGTTVKSFQEHEVTKSPKKKKSAAQVAEKTEPFTVDYLLKNRTACFIDPADFLSTLSKDEKMVVEQKVKMLQDFEFQLISEDEIGFSVLYSSLEKYCNPLPPPKEAFTIPEPKPSAKKVVDEKKNTKEVEPKSSELSPKKAPAKTIKDMFKRSTPSAPVTINLDEKSADEKPSKTIKKTVEKAAEDKKKKQAEEKKKVAEEEKRQAEEKAKAEEEKKRVAEEKKRLAEEKKKAAAEEKKKQEEEKKRLAEEEKKQKAEEKKKAAEEEEKRLAEEKKQKAEEEKKRKQAEEKKKAAEEAEKKRVAAEKTNAKKKESAKTSSKELSSDENKQTEAVNDSSTSNKRPKLSLSTARSASSKKISLSTAKGTTSSHPSSSADKSDNSVHQEDPDLHKDPQSQRKRVIKDEDANEDKMDLDSNDVNAVLASNTNHQVESGNDQKQGTKRKRSGSLANSFDESDDKQDKANKTADAGATDPGTNNTNQSLLATPQSRNVKRFKKSVSPVEKSPRPKIISTEVHDLSKDKKEHEIWFKESEKEYTEEEKKQKEADALFSFSLKNATASTKKKVK